MSNLKIYNRQTGQWEELKVNTRLKMIKNSVTLTAHINHVDIGITEYNPEDDGLLVYKNGEYQKEGRDFIFIPGALKIKTVDNSNWQAGTIFDFIVLKNVQRELPSADGSLIQPNSITDDKLAEGIKIAPALINKNGMVYTDLKTRFDHIDDQIAEIEQKKAIQHVVDVSRFGYDANAIKAAVASLKDGDTLYFPKALTNYQIMGEYIKIDKENITIIGNGKIITDRGFLISKGGFIADGLNMENPTYSLEAIAIRVDIPEGVLKKFHIRNCSFKNFFYAVRIMGQEYSSKNPITTYKIRDVIIESCYSETFTDRNAAHFNVIGVENVSMINNITYGGQNATSYNAINTNGYLRIIGNYDENNSFGGCEIENASGKAIINGNTFKTQIWIDDSHDVIISNNITNKIFISVGSNHGNVENAIVSNNITGSIGLRSYGNYLGGKIKSVLIKDNIVRNSDGTHGILVDGNYVEFAVIEGNFIDGVFSTSKIGIIRNNNLTAIIRNNNVNGVILISSTGGKVYGVHNYGATYSGERDNYQVDYKDIAADGITLLSENGARYRLYVGNSGTVYTVAY